MGSGYFSVGMGYFSVGMGYFSVSLRPACLLRGSLFGILFRWPGLLFRSSLVDIYVLPYTSTDHSFIPLPYSQFPDPSYYYLCTGIINHQSSPAYNIISYFILQTSYFVSLYPIHNPQVIPSFNITASFFLALLLKIASFDDGSYTFKECDYFPFM